jgi:AcrR family transcriptional regulator
MSELQRARLFAAAAEVVSELGYSGMTAARVSARAGVSRKTFYDLFADREDCFLAVFDDTVTRIAAVAGPAFEGEGSWREGVRAGLLSVLQFIGDEPGLGALVVVHALGAGPKVLQRRAQWLETLNGIVDQGRGEVKPGREPAVDLGRSGLTAEGVVGAVLSVLHARLLERDGDPFVELLNPLMAIIVLPYLGPPTAEQELARPTPETHRLPARPVRSPLEDLEMRITQRTLQVITAVAEHPGASNREVADRAGISDEGQISKLLARLARLGLVANDGAGQAKGEPNAWTLTAKGQQVEEATRGQLV